jgi:hypothetical protein
MRMDFVARILDRWRAEGTRVNPGATPDQLARLARILGPPLPPDIRRFYESANGMEDWTYDRCLVGLWSIERIESDAAAYPRKASLPAVREIAFGDFLYHSHAYVYRLTTSGQLVVGHDMDPTDEFPTLDDLFRRYLEDPDRMPVLIGAESLDSNPRR